MYTHGSSRTYVQSNATRIARSPVGTLHIYGAPPGWGKGRNSHGDDETQVGYGEGKKRIRDHDLSTFALQVFTVLGQQKKKMMELNLTLLLIFSSLQL